MTAAPCPESATAEPQRASARLGPRLCLVALLASACAREPYPREPIVESVELDGVSGGEADDVIEGLATQESERFLFIWDGITHDYETLDDTVLATDLERIERYFQARGFYEARVTSARVLRTDPHRVKIEVHVDKGQPVLTRHLRLEGIEHIDIEAAASTLTSIQLKEHEPFDEDVFEQSKKDITNTLANSGYAYAKVEGTARVDVAGHTADVEFRVEPGPKAHIGSIRIDGLKEIPRKPVLEAFQVEEGDPYSRLELERARRAVFDLGVFTRVVVDQDLSNPASGAVPVVLRVTESSLRSLTLGVGARIDVERTTGYLQTSWEHHNFLGGLRRLTLSERPGLTAYPTRIDFIRAPTRALFENDVAAELRQPSFLEGRTTGWSKARYSVYPLLYPLADGVNPDDETIIGYNEIGTAVGLDRVFFDNHVPISLSYHWNANIPRAYQVSRAVNETGINVGDLVDQLDNVYVSYPELNVALDFRDDPVSPKKGVYLNNSLQVANPLLAGTVTDVRVQSGLRTFYPLSRDGDIVLAARFKLGFVFPRNYGGTFDKNSELSSALYQSPEDPRVIDDQQKILFRTFYSGGPNSNRGYAYRQVGPQGPIGFLLQNGQDCAQRGAEILPAECLRPLGGFSLWEASMEIRFPLAGPLWGTLFMDTSDVASDVAFISFDSPHLSVGPGLRYRTPIGPIRLDVGYRVPGWQVRGSHGTPRYFPDTAQLPEFRAKLPFAYHIAIGEAF